jgi:hypothetical protein
MPPSWSRSPQRITSSTLLARHAAAPAPDAKPAPIRISLKNLGQKIAEDSFSVRIEPPGSTTVLPVNEFNYRLAPGELTAMEFELQLSPTTKTKRVRLHVARSSRGVGRREVALDITVDDTKPSRINRFSGMPVNWLWLPDQSRERPPHWEHREFGR